MISFCRDIFDVGIHQAETIEFFYPVPFYFGNHFLMKLYRWSVNNTNGTVVSRYHWERSEMILGQLYYVLGKSYSNEHLQIEPYAALHHIIIG